MREEGVASRRGGAGELEEGAGSPGTANALHGVRSCVAVGAAGLGMENGQNRNLSVGQGRSTVGKVQSVMPHPTWCQFKACLLHFLCSFLLCSQKSNRKWPKGLGLSLHPCWKPGANPGSQLKLDQP